MTTVMLAALLAFGVNYGWEKQPDGSYQYIIQLEPHTVELLKQGDPVSSDIPPDYRGIRSFKIVVGTDPVPRTGNPAEQETPPSPVVQTANQAPEAAAPFKPFGMEQPEPTPPATTPKPDESATGTKTDPASDTPASPPQRWVPLTLAVALLVASVSGNLYLGMMIWEMRGRYRRLLHRTHGAATA